MKHNQHILLAPSDYPLIASPTLAKAYGVAAVNRTGFVGDSIF